MPVPSELPHDPSAAPLPPSPSAGRRPAGPRPALLAPARPRRCPAKLTPQTGRINHVGLTVSSVPHAEAAVYSPLLTFLGFLNCRPYAGRRPGRPATSVWCNPRHRFGVVLYEAERGGAGSTRGAVGLQHLCLNAGSRSEVDEVARMCARLEMEVDGPKKFDISPGYYSCHVHDIDGIHLEVAYSPGLWESVETYPPASSPSSPPTWRRSARRPRRKKTARPPSFRRPRRRRRRPRATTDGRPRG
ncbi:MAG: hypothetical protein BJ554DRAFT_1789, partial [Olpidium bornovanus]